MPGPEFPQTYQRTLLRNACLTACLLLAGIHSHSVKAADTPSVHQDRSAGAAAVELVMQALGLQGVNYRWGGSRPQEGLDCSGLVQHVYREAAGLILPRRSEDMSRSGVPVAREQLEPGDLVFFNTRRQAYSHVGIYIGSGRFVHAPSTGGQVRTEGLSTPYWRTRFDGARRMVTPQTAAARTEGPVSVARAVAPRPPRAARVTQTAQAPQARTGGRATDARPRSPGASPPVARPGPGRPTGPEQLSSARSMVDPPGARPF